MGLFDRLPIIGGLLDNSSDEMTGAAKDSRATWGQLDPRQNYLQRYQEYVPEDAQYQTITEDPNLKQNYSDYLGKLAGLSTQGFSPEDEYNFFKANQDAQSLGQSREASAIENARARGVAGGGMEFAMREMGNQGAAKNAQEANLASAANAAKMRQLYTQAYGNAVNQGRQADLNVSSKNADIINAFNKYNTGARNEARLRNIDEQNRVTQANYNNASGWAKGVQGANSDISSQYKEASTLNGGLRRENGNNINRLIQMMAGGG